MDLVVLVDEAFTSALKPGEVAGSGVDAAAGGGILVAGTYAASDL